MLTMKFVLILSSLFITNNALNPNWDHYKKQHGKNYRNIKEDNARLRIYQENLEELGKHNKRFKNGLESYEKGVNQFSDWSKDEFILFLKLNGGQLMGGYLPNSSLYETSLGQVDDMVDWRKKGAVTPVKQQGQCGSCWAFSSTGALEGQHQILNNKLVSLSEQNLLDCTSSYGNMGCSGGLMTSTFKYVTDHGVTTEEKYPYTGIVGQCKQSNVVLKAKGYKEIRSNDEKSLQQAVSSVGPISVAVHANTNLQSYKSGVFSDRSCSNTELNHAVLIVGYTPEYWIVKNSWGSAWGEHGYAKFRRGTNMCGIAASASFPVL